jgi:DNA polymerase III epsilon subunit-like protein
VIMKRECFISVDIEAAGPIPGEYSMLSLGACPVFSPDVHFSCEFKPVSIKADPEALKITGGSLKDFEERGLSPEVGMGSFRDWIAEVSGTDSAPVFVGFNAPFDWSFVNYYFHRFLGENPFGFTALDVKAYYMGRFTTTWAETKSSAIANFLKIAQTGDHNPLHDAIYQAQLFREVMSRVTQDKIATS